MGHKLNDIGLWGSVAAFTLSAASLTAISHGSTSVGYTAVTRVAAVVFWIGLLIGIVLQILLSVRMRRWRAKFRVALQGMKTRPRLGLISFFKNPLGLISDAVFLVSMIVFVILNIVTDATGIVCYIFLSLLFLSFCTHCIFNGRNYYYITNRKTIENMRKKLEEESL